MDGLFRDEAVKLQRPQALGTVSLATPLSFAWWALLAVAFAAAIVLFLIFGHYTRRETVSGQLTPAAGLLTLSTQTTGTVTRVLVHEGEKVEAGQPLIEFSSSLISTSMGNTHAVVAAQLRTQEAETRTTLANLQPQTAAQTEDLRARISMLETQVKQFNAQLLLQRKEAASASNLLQRIVPLHRRGIISTVEFDQYQDTALTHQADIKTLIRQLLDTKEQLSQLRAQLAQLPLTVIAKASQLRGQLSQLEAQLAQNASQDGTVLRASKAGLVSALLVTPGQSVVAGQPVLSILPKGSKLEAQLLVPSSAIGLMALGSRVVIRYQSFPYRRFGQQYGKVTRVSRSALNPAEIQLLTGNAGSGATPLYRVLVQLNRQDIDVYGKSQPLIPGMALSADILLGRTSLWAWIFDPLNGLRQKLKTGGARRT